MSGVGREEPPPAADLAPESRLILARMGELGLLDRPAETPAQMRANARAEEVLIGAPREVGKVEEIEIAGDDPGATIEIRLYHPKQRAERAILWLHGGGWVVGSLEAADAGCRSLCLDTAALVASVDYRLAPEHPFPSGVEDCFAALRWLDQRLASVDEPLPLIVAGDSAGGNLAAALCFLARERGGPSIEHQLLLYPVTDHDFDTASYRAYGEGYGLTREVMRRFWRHYVGASDEEVDQLAAVLRATDLRDLPPATVVIAGCDVLRDEGEAYAARLRGAGVPVAILRYAGQMHGFWSYSALSDISRAVNEDIRGTLAAIGPGRIARLGRPGPGARPRA